MNKNSQKYFTTGEFAHLCNIGKDTLFHYDKIGIFCPEIKESNGYRYYSYWQIEVFRVISILRDLDMPLSEIKQYLDTRSPEQLISILEEKELVIAEKIEELQKMQHLIKKKVQITRSALKISDERIIVSKCPEEYLILSKPIDSSDDRKIARALAEHIKFCEGANIYSPYAIGGMLLAENIKKGITENYLCFYTRVDKEEQHISIFTKEQGLYLTAYHRGGFHTISQTYHKIIQYMQENHLACSSNFYEDALFDDLSIKGYENYLLKISLKVCSR